MIQRKSLLRTGILLLPAAAVLFFAHNYYRQHLEAQLRQEIRENIKKELDEDWRVLSQARRVAMAQDSNPNQISSLEMLAFFGEIGLKPTLSYVEIGNISFTIDRIMKPEGAIYIDYQGHL